MTNDTETTLPVLYSYIDCPYCQRARMALAASGQKCELREVALPEKPQALLEVSPKGTVPVLVQPDGTVIDESMEIVHWALAQDDPLNWRQFEIPQVEVKGLMDENDSRFAKAMIRAKMPEKFAGEDDDTDWDAVAQDFLGKLNQKLDSYRYIAGNHITLADICIAPFVLIYAAVKPEAVEPHEKVIPWLEGFHHSDLFRRTMKEYPAWEAGQELVIFP